MDKDEIFKKELGLVIYSKDTTINTNDKLEIHNCDDFGIDKIEELIKYLQKVKRHIKKYNKKNETN